MNRRGSFLASAGVIVAIIIAVVAWPREKEPEFKGRKLSEWVGEFQGPPQDWLTGTPGVVKMHTWNRGGHSEEEAMEAVRHIGTNGLPFLVRWVGYETLGWKPWIFRSSTNLPGFLTRTRFCRWLVEDHASYRADAAMETLQKLGREALPAVKGLSRIQANGKSPIAARRAWIAMAGIGNVLAKEDAETGPPSRSVASSPDWYADGASSPFVPLPWKIEEGPIANRP